MKIIDESERLKGEMVGVSLEEEEGIRKRKGVVNNLAEQETSRLLNLSRWIGHHHQSAQAGLIIIAVRLNPVNHRLLIGEEELKTSQYETSQGGWVEKDPETTQSFKRRQQVWHLESHAFEKCILFLLFLGGTAACCYE